MKPEKQIFITEIFFLCCITVCLLATYQIYNEA